MNAFERGAEHAQAFVPRSQVFSSEDLARVLRRLAHEIVERNHGIADVVLLGLQTGGIAFVDRLGATISLIENIDVPVGCLDVTAHRDDRQLRVLRDPAVTNIPVDIGEKTVVLVDDVLFTGRTVRAAMSALSAYGRPKRVQLAVLIDRGHRELPIRPDFVGKNLPTRRAERVMVDIDAGVWIGDMEEQ